MHADSAKEQFEQLITFAQNLGLDSLVSSWKSAHELLEMHRVRVVILGEFNHGKSSLINGIIGEKVLPYGVTPTTQIDTWILFGQPERCVKAYSGPQVIEKWSWEAWQGTACQNMPEVLKNRACNRLEISIDTEPVDKNCIFIDTPGLNEAFLSRESYLKRYMNSADMLIFVLDANQALTHTEQAIVRDVVSELKPERRLLVINKCDSLDDDEWLDICHYVEEALSPMIGRERFYMVSAKKKKVGDWGVLMERLHDGISRSRSDLERDAAERQIREMRRIAEGLLAIWHALAELSKDEKKALRGSISDAHLTSLEQAEILHEMTNEIDRLKRQTACDFERFMTDFIRVMPREIDKAQLDDIEAFFEDFIDETYAEFSESIIQRLDGNVHEIIQRAARRMLGVEIRGYHFRLHFKEVEMLNRSPVPTGAFDVSSSFGLWNLPLPGLISGYAEHPRREAIKAMAQNAIRRRCDQYVHAFDEVLSRKNDVMATLIRECGMQLNDIVPILIEKSGQAIDLDEELFE